jgi:hypothetical protein
LIKNEQVKNPSQSKILVELFKEQEKLLIQLNDVYQQARLGANIENKLPNVSRALLAFQEKLTLLSQALPRPDFFSILAYKK